MGEIHSTDHFKQHYEVDQVLYTDELSKFVEEAGSQVYHVLYGLNTDSGAHATPATFVGMDQVLVQASSSVNKDVLFDHIVELRVHKTAQEIALLRHVNNISSDAHIAVMARTQVGMREFQLESMFRHWTYFIGGCRNQSYTSICGCGKNSAVLHYGHAGAPNDRVITANDMCLLDMGAEYHCYASDITCSFPASGKFSEKQRGIYLTVKAAADAVMAAMKPGVHWKDMHELANRVTCTELRTLGLVQGDVDAMVAANVGAVFMPHGLGHLMGIDTHDVGGIPKEIHANRDKRLGWKGLRCWRPLEEGMVITVEPGVYFNEWLLRKSFEDPELAPFLVKEVCETYIGFGGVRLEDDVLVTADGIENLTCVPRTIDDVEATMAGKISRRDELGDKGRYYRGL